MTEREMIEGCRAGDASARQELYRRLGPPMFGVCHRYLKDRQAAEDVLHDGFVTIYTKIGEYRGEGAFPGWCRRIFINTALGYLRRKNPLSEADSTDGIGTLRDRDPSPLEKMSAQELMDCMNELPDGYRAVLNLYAVEGYSHREAADMMGISENTSRSQYMRAKARLAAILRKRGIL